MKTITKPTYQELEQQIEELKHDKIVLQSDEKLEDFFNLSPNLMIITNPEGQVFKINKACIDILGYTEKEMQEISLWSLAHPNDVEKTKKIIEEQIESKEVLSFVNRGKHKNGTYVTFEWHVSIIKDDLVYAIAKDITDRNNIIGELITAKDRSEKSEKELTKTQEITRVGSWTLDLTTNEVTWTNELYRMYGFDPRLPVPQYSEHESFFQPESWKALSEAIAQIIETGIPYELELETVGDNDTRWMWVRGEVITDKDNEIIGLLGAAQDITKRKKLELELIQLKEDSTKSLETILVQKDASLDATVLELQDYQNAIDKSSIITMTDSKGIILSANKYFTDISGYSEKELLGQNQNIVSSHTHSKTFWKEMWKTIGKGGTWSGQIKNKRKDGSFYWVHTVIYPFIVNGKPIKYLSIRNDITELVEGEEIKLALETTEISLNEKMTLLKEVHHRVKNNLQVITGLISLQKSSLKDEKLEGFFNDLNLRIQSITTVHELLYQSNDLGKINTKEYLNNLINGILNSYKFVDETITVDIDVAIENINLATSIPLGLIINEIVTNTCKYAIIKGEENKIFVKLNEKEEGFVLEIGDNGNGFVENKEHKKSLGLKLIKQLSKQLKGEILKDNNYNGTRYILNFKEINE